MNNGELTVNDIVVAMRIINRMKPIVKTSTMVPKGKTYIVNQKHLRDEYYNDLSEGFRRVDEAMGRELYADTDTVVVCHPDDAEILQSTIDEAWK